MFPKSEVDSETYDIGTIGTLLVFDLCAIFKHRKSRKSKMPCSAILSNQSGRKSSVKF